MREYYFSRPYLRDQWEGERRMRLCAAHVDTIFGLEHQVEATFIVQKTKPRSGVYVTLSRQDFLVWWTHKGLQSIFYSAVDDEFIRVSAEEGRDTLYVKLKR